MKGLLSIMKKFLWMTLVFMLMMLLVMPVETLAANAYVKSMTLSDSSVSIQASKSKTVTATVSVSGSASKYVTASSSNSSIATVSVSSPSSGKTKITIKGIKKGTAFITVTTKGKGSNGRPISKRIKVVVGYAPVSTMTLNYTSKTISVNSTFILRPTISPSTANKSVTFTSSNTAVATVSASGLVKGIKAGTAYITVKTKTKTSAGGYLEKKCKVVVK